MRNALEQELLKRFKWHFTSVVRDDLVSIKKGSTVKISESEIEALYEKSGSSAPKLAARAISRWRGFYEPYFRAGVSGTSLRVVCITDHVRRVNDFGVVEEKDRVKAAKDVVVVDRDYYEAPKEVQFLLKPIELGRNVFLAGPSGCGKNEFFYRTLEKIGRLYERVNMDGDLTKGDFVGDWILKATEKGPEMVYLEGVLMHCMKEGKAMIVDELDAAAAEVLFTLQAVLEGNPLMDTKRVERIEAQPGFQILATANTVGKGDFSSLYAGTRLMNESTLDRFHYIIRMRYPDVSAETKILVRRTGISQTWAKQIARLAESVRKMSEDGSIYGTFSLRKSLNFAQALMDEINPRDAFRATVLDRISLEDAAKVSEAANRIIDFDLSLVDF